MNMEHKFRAWDTTTDNTRMINWDELQTFPIYSVFIPLSRELHLMQFTGLKDKNGKEIYEGDTAKVILPMGGFWGDIKTYKIGFVKWNEDRCRFMVEWRWSKNQHHIDLNCDLDIEVIGNIYENPELLK